MQDPKTAKNANLATIAQIYRAISLQLRHVSTIGKKLVKQLQISPQYGEQRALPMFGKQASRWALAHILVKVYFTTTTTTITTRILLHPFNDLFSRTTWVSRHQKGKPFWILLEQEMIGWQWHQLDNMQIICTSFQTDSHASTSPLSFYRLDAVPVAQPTASKH